MSMTVEESDEGKCFSSKIRHLEKAEITHSKMITCPDIEDYLAPYKQPQMTWYKVSRSGETREGRAEGRFCDGRVRVYLAGVREGGVEKHHHG